MKLPRIDTGLPFNVRHWEISCRRIDFAFSLFGNRLIFLDTRFHSNKRTVKSAFFARRFVLVLTTSVDHHFGGIGQTAFTDTDNVLYACECRCVDHSVW
jgi:hypothetical protein